VDITQFPCNDADLILDFLDHIMRQLPSENYTMIKRSFFSRGNMSQQLDDCITALKGCYASMRLCSVSIQPLADFEILLTIQSVRPLSVVIIFLHLQVLLSMLMSPMARFGLLRMFINVLVITSNTATLARTSTSS
jgi:hypothetical protein